MAQEGENIPDVEGIVAALTDQIESAKSYLTFYATNVKRYKEGKQAIGNVGVTSENNQKAMAMCYETMDWLNEKGIYLTASEEASQAIMDETAQIQEILLLINDVESAIKAAAPKQKPFVIAEEVAIEEKNSEPILEEKAAPEPVAADLVTKMADESPKIDSAVSGAEPTEDELLGLLTRDTRVEEIKPAEVIVDDKPSQTPLIAESSAPTPAKKITLSEDIGDTEMEIVEPVEVIKASEENETPVEEIVSGPLIDDDETLGGSETVVSEIGTKQAEIVSDETVDENPFEYIDPTKSLYNVKANSRSQTNKFLKRMIEYDPNKIDPSKIRLFDYDGNDTAFRKEYLASRNNMIASPRISRTGLLMSGHFEEISSYGNWDLASIGRTVTNKMIDFVDRELALYNSIYEHVRYVSYSPAKPEFDEWAKHIYFPDRNSLFFGVYDANSVGKNHYTITCPYCNESIVTTRENKELAIAIDKGFTSAALERFITCRDIMSVDTSPLFRWARDTEVRKTLNNTKYIVIYKVPTLYDYFTTIATVRSISKRDGRFINIAAIDDMDSDDALRILIYMYVSAIGIPAPIEGTDKIKYIKVTEKADIIEIINTLVVDDYVQLFNGKDVQELIARRAADYYIEDTVCPIETCKKTIKHIALDPKETFFFKIGEVANALSLR